VQVTRALEGRTVFVLEDEYLLADDLQRWLEAEGATILGPTATLAEGLRLLRDGAAPDLAILDIGVRGESVFPVADLLAGRGIPFVFATAYDEARLPQRYRGRRSVTKPYDRERLIAALAELSPDPA
jgi:CheY-like chemotaxis protein